MKVFHVINGLGNGGAEGVLVRLITNYVECDHYIISLGKGNYHLETLHRAGINIYQYELKGLVSFITSLLSMVRLLRKEKPDVIQTWLYHSDFIGSLAALFSGYRKRLIWNIRNSDLSSQTSRFTTRKLVSLLAVLSKFMPQKILCCSLEAINIHVSLGYPRHKFRFVPNGVDTNTFAPNTDFRHHYRMQKIGSLPQFLIGMAARFDSQKDHKNLLSAVKILLDKGLKIKVVLAGSNVDEDNGSLTRTINDLGISRDVVLVGREQNMEMFYNSLDCHVLSSSYGEAFPNVVVEAMSCGVICVGTDVGDTRHIINDTGLVVAKEQSKSLANAIEKLYFMNQDLPEKFWQLSHSSRKRVIENYSLDQFLENYGNIWSDIRE